MRGTARTNGGTKIRSRCSVVVVDPRSSPKTASSDAASLLQDYVRGERGRKLRSELANMHPRRCADEVEDAIQTACNRFLDRAEGISTPGEAYAWLRTTAHRQLNRRDERCEREVTVDPTWEGSLGEAVATDPTPEEEVIAEEDEGELVELVEEVASELPERRRDVLALYGAGASRRQIAHRLGMSEGRVKRDLLAIMDRTRAALVRRSDGGCLRGEPLVMRFACGLTTPTEAEQARRHLTRCGRCEHFSEQLSAWREKAPAVLPFPAADQATPGLVERVAHRAAEGVSTLKQQVFEGGAQLKQQAAVGYYRAVDPTPLAAARPGTVAAVVAGCISLGSGATYCVERGVDPLGAARGLVAASEEKEPPQEQPPPEPPEPPPVAAPPPEPPVSEEVPVAEAVPPTEVEEPAPEPPPPPPPPEQTFEPASPEYQASTSTSESAEPRPAPVPADSAPEFGGP